MPTFELTLPETGGSLELFDVMGRRIAQRDLVGLPSGHHTVTLAGGAMRAGVYFARLKQRGAEVHTRLVWAR